MCSRYSLTSPPQAVSAMFGGLQIEDFPPRYNIAPTDPALIARTNLAGRREMHLVRWGLIPSWVKDPRQFATLINARAESVLEKPSYRGPLRHRRCLVPADGFYEWTGKRGQKQPHFIRLASGAPMAFAGLWETWLGADGSEIDTMAIITTAANADVAPLHERMPVILNPADYECWLDCSGGTADGAADLLRPLSQGRLTITPVSRRVNDPRAEGPDLHEPDAGGQAGAAAKGRRPAGPTGETLL